MTDQKHHPEQPGPPKPARFGIVRMLAAATAILGALMIVLALAGGGGLGSYGVLVGSLFLAAGLMRLRLLSVRSRR